ncbi:SymE family type I addiction module toxin [Chitinophaga sp. Hz27]|uniref:Type I addiction module toxin, SymE family n=1 Tax=Chitinophaga silvatica TaxID=2282649 RepID=A0A3E1YHE2_9BACT|nr:SymE family type I addiction module toxin [Chitinophaga silvatica]RFS26786.1 type I addiction module toxin, SymE family [Chitinophaga silvatica]
MKTSHFDSIIHVTWRTISGNGSGMNIPQIILSGKWLKAAGISPDDKLRIRITPGKLTLLPANPIPNTKRQARIYLRHLNKVSNH